MWPCKPKVRPGFSIDPQGRLVYRHVDSRTAHPQTDPGTIDHVNRYLKYGNLPDPPEPIRAGNAWTPAVSTDDEQVEVRIEDRRNRRNSIPIGVVRLQVPDPSPEADAAYAESKERQQAAQKVNVDLQAAWDAEQMARMQAMFPDLKSWDLRKKCEPWPTYKRQHVPPLAERPMVSNPNFAEELSSLRAVAEERASDMNIMQEVCK